MVKLGTTTRPIDISNSTVIGAEIDMFIPGQCAPDEDN